MSLAGAEPRPVALEGDLAGFPATDVLQFLKLAAATGRLEVERNGERVDIGFAHGQPLWARTTGRSVRLGDVLVHRGWASAEDVDAALEDPRHLAGERLGALLRERGVAHDLLQAAVAEVFRRLVFLLSLWPDGRFRFVPGALEPADDAALDLELDRVILEGLHQADLAQGPA